MQHILLSWVGHTDLKAPAEHAQIGLGPIAQTVTARQYDQVHLIADCPEAKLSPYLEWLQSQTTASIIVYDVKLTSPVDFGEIYEAVVHRLEKLTEDSQSDLRLTFHLSPGTPAMAAVWIILAKTRFPAELIESSREHGVRTASVPFDISADFIPDLLKSPDEKLVRASTGAYPETLEFSQILYRSNAMERAVHMARIVAPRTVAVLIEGESGTGKELLARAIHTSSPRRKSPFIAVNCGAIPPTLVEANLFGYVKGAFTGADKDRPGLFEAANNGTLFLDEIGDLPLDVQVKLLRVLQEGAIVKVGSTDELPVDVRIISATNHNLLEKIDIDQFRQDLFYRIAVAIIKLPPVRERVGDISLLMDALMVQVNEESTEEPGYQDKELSAGAKNLMLLHPWPGNVREMVNTIRRAAIFSSGPVITREEMQDAIIPMTHTYGSDILNRPLGESSKLPDLIEKVVAHYLGRALEEAGSNKTKAAELVGLPNYQTFTNWMKKYNVE